VAAVAEAFAVKFSDVGRRRRVLYGDDPFEALAVEPEALRRRARQVALNLTLRLRRSYALDGGREEAMARDVADSAAPLRAAAAAVLELEGERVASGRDALARFIGHLPESDWREVLDTISAAREDASLPARTAAPSLLRIIELAEHLRRAVTPGSPQR